MLNYISVLIFIAGGFFFIFDEESTETNSPLEERTVYEIALALGDKDLKHELNQTIPGVSAEKGKELFHTGYTTKPNGRRTKKQSKHYVCTSCHNFVKEDSNLGSPSPEDRLNYANSNGLPFLQGTTMHGVVNRRTFYNGDYKHKYGLETVIKVKEDLRESIQLCAVGCAQGRSLDTWEIESILAYYWTLQLNISDLKINRDEKIVINNALERNENSESALSLLKEKYSEAAPATFHETPEDWNNGYPYVGNAKNGKQIYEKSCMHCHQNGRYSYYSLKVDNLSLKHLSKHFSRKKSGYSSYKLITKGTLPVYGDKAYMPQYPIERMSKQQIEDLRAYVDGI